MTRLTICLGHFYRDHLKVYGNSYGNRLLLFILKTLLNDILSILYQTLHRFEIPNQTNSILNENSIISWKFCILTHILLVYMQHEETWRDVIILHNFRFIRQLYSYVIAHTICPNGLFICIF